MPTLETYQEDKPIKMLVIGNSGSGKTGALESLVRAGYKLRVLDYDNGLDILAQRLKDSPELLKNVAYKTMTDEIQMVGNVIMTKGAPKAFQEGLKFLNNFDDLGPVTSWGRDTILAIDSLSMMGKTAVARALYLNGRPGQRPELQDWGDAVRWIEDTLSLLYSDAVQCHVIINTHVQFVESKDDKSIFGFPAAVGSKLPPKVGRFFNHILQADVQGTGKAAKRILRTVPQGMIDVKCPIKDLPSTLPIETGLAEYFAKVLDKKE